MQGADALVQGPTRRGPGCLTPLLPLLRAEAVSPALLPIYAAAWLLVRVVVETRADSDALLAVLALDGSIECSLRCSLWDSVWSQVRSSRACASNEINVSSAHLSDMMLSISRSNKCIQSTLAS